MACYFFSQPLPHLFFYFVLFSSLTPFVFPLSTVSISEISNKTLVCALVNVPGATQSSLNCSSFPSGIQIPSNSKTSFSAIVGGDGFLCGLISLSLSPATSTLVCWRFSVNGTIMSYKRIYQRLALSQLEAGNSVTCGLVNTTNRLECWPRRKFRSVDQNFSSMAVGEDFVCGLLEYGNIACLGSYKAVVGQFPKGNYSAIAAGSRHACAINFTGELDCWGMPGEKPPQGEFISMALGENRGCALRTNETVVCWGQGNFSLPERLRETRFSTIEAKRKVFCGVQKSDFSLYCWGNENFNPNSIVFKSVLPGPCRSSCGLDDIIGGSGRWCPEGQQICRHSKSNIGNSVPPAVAPPPPPTLEKRCKWSGKMIAFLVVGCVGSLILLLVVGFFLFKYCKCRGCRVHDSGRLDGAGPGAPVEQGGGPSQPHAPQAEEASPVLEKRLSQLVSMGNAGHLEEFSLQVILEATNNFSHDKTIGTGSFGSVYQATLEDGREVAIKRAEISNTSSYAVGTRRQEDKDDAFVNELESLSRLHHKNLVRLLGFCEDSNERVLVYEYVHNGTLHDHLHKLENSPLMSWAARIKVALDAARGVEYLHRYAVPPVIHRDIKSSNILLDSTWTAKVSDFGLSLMGPEDDMSYLSLRAAGTVGYIDPEYYRLQQLTTKSDVYSFGVVLLEMLSGLKAIHKNENGVPRNVVDFVVPYIVQDEIHRVLDSRVPPPTPFEIEAVIYIGYLAADCVTLEGRDRPSMAGVVNSLEKALAACLVHPTSLSRSTTGGST
ncbi:serine/threonine-protein kinase-like protein CCR4 [Populus alba]|uniref:serine/threonine-protein kinase-like protein CCR4 n=1 Tax=Populus alba TaxID=43335 RepID=UPI0015891E5D|nr:serine/threonine-protein kinase-like protein CCR4 [Populus alba]